MSTRGDLDNIVVQSTERNIAAAVASGHLTSELFVCRAWCVSLQSLHSFFFFREGVCLLLSVGATVASFALCVRAHGYSPFTRPREPPCLQILHVECTFSPSTALCISIDAANKSSPTKYGRLEICSTSPLVVREEGAISTRDTRTLVYSRQWCTVQ